MEWLNIHASFLDSPAFVGCEPTERATWLCLMRYCAGQENGGVIAGASAWTDRKWQQLARVTLAEVKADCALWSWSAGNLRVLGYPEDKERVVKEKRNRARTNGRAGGRPETKPETNIGSDIGSVSKPMLPDFAKAEGEGEGKENTLPVPAKPARKRDEIFDCLAKAEGSNPEQLTKRAARTIAVAASEIRKATPTVTAEEVARRAQQYRRVMPPGSTLTASALAKHWARCGEVVRLGHVAPARPAEPPGWRERLKSLFPDSTYDGPWSLLPQSAKDAITNPANQ